MDDFIACVLGPENTQRVVDGPNDIVARGALVFVEENPPMIGLLNELFCDVLESAVELCVFYC